MQRLSKKKPIEESSSESQKHTNQNKYHSDLDVWLSRLSHLSQFGLLALTIGAFYFTVIPLYKTAALEESIARREAELSAMNSKLIAATASLEKVKLEIYERNRTDLIKGIISIAPYCSGLITRPDPTNTSEGKELGYHLLKVDAAQCMRDEFKQRKAEAILTADDYSQLKDKIEIIAVNLSQIQKKALFDINSVPELAANDPTTLTPPGHYAEEAEQLDRLIENLAPGLIDKNAKLQAAIDRTRSKISIDYNESVSKEILKLRTINWLSSKQL
ncbi:hypothetical protein PS662_01178 [Pseudomonas fluorescens]|uniref:Uncharacterized protein n=1 Tax=Pseudomonas fluorescens TaxID=294 RepID=A0A5E6R1Y4_PSEFL|nr:hypothetical protein [Pseudomonas fluorescens]VVM58405.1 hypothetical protein PS662_01178 [Pseudomonas fluorescens]